MERSGSEMGLKEELQKLNEAQRAVVENLNQPLLVMAPAGTGKTNVRHESESNIVFNFYE